MLYFDPDVFVQFWHKREQIQCTVSVYSYLQKAVRNACINVRLREEVRRKYEQEIKYTGEYVFDWREAEELRHLRQKLFDAMERLPERCRKIFMMSCVEGLKYREIAAQMGISENTIKTQIKLGYKKLRDEMNLPEDKGDKGDKWLSAFLDKDQEVDMKALANDIYFFGL